MFLNYMPPTWQPLVACKCTNARLTNRRWLLTFPLLKMTLICLAMYALLERSESYKCKVSTSCFLHPKIEAEPKLKCKCLVLKCIRCASKGACLSYGCGATTTQVKSRTMGAPTVLTLNLLPELLASTQGYCQHAKQNTGKLGISNSERVKRSTTLKHCIPEAASHTIHKTEYKHFINTQLQS